MRKKLPATEKRSKIIGVKVKPETREQIEWIAKREVTQLSTYIDSLLQEHIKKYFKYNHIEWKKLTEEERSAK